jgi:hypothetical protein
VSGGVAHPAVDEQVHDGEVEEGQQTSGYQPVMVVTILIIIIPISLHRIFEDNSPKDLSTKSY